MSVQVSVVNQNIMAYVCYWLVAGLWSHTHGWHMGPGMLVQPQNSAPCPICRCFVFFLPVPGHTSLQWEHLGMSLFVQQSLLLRCCNYVWGHSLSSVHRAGYAHNRCSIKAYWVSERGALIGSAVACRGSLFCHFLRNPLGMWQRGGSSVQGSSVRTSSGSWVPCIQNCTCLRTGLASSGWWARWARAGQGAPGLQVWLTNSVKERPLHGDSWPLPHPSPLFIHCPSFSPWVSGPQVQNVSTGSISELVSTASYFTDGNWGLENWCSQVLFFYTNSYHMTSSLNNWTSY